jgi:beta-glucosidase
VVEAGDFVIAVGDNSRDLPLTQTITVDAPPVAAPLTEWSTYQEWIADDDGRALLDEAAAAGQPDLRAYGDLVEVIGNFPLMSLTTFVGMSPDHDTVKQMAATWAQHHGGNR